MVEWKKLGECLDYEQPTPYLVKSTDYDDSYHIPVLTAGQSLLLGYTNETEGIYKADKERPTIIFDDFTTSYHWIDYDFKVKSSAMKMLQPKLGVNFRYVYYAMQGIKFIPTQHQRHWISKYSQFEIPIPSKEEQTRIVGILDTFTASIANLKSQIKERRKQYEYYRDQLLDLEGKDGVEWKKLGEVCEILDNLRRPIAKSQRKSGIYPYYGANGVQDYVENYIFDGTFLLMGEDGSVINEDKSPILHWATGKIWVNNHAHILKETDSAYLRYVYYSLQCADVSDIVRGVPPKINQANLRNIQIPIPSKEEQERIVGILDTFTTSIANLEAQLKEREKQYEYYRNQLLTFE